MRSPSSLPSPLKGEGEVEGRLKTNKKEKKREPSPFLLLDMQGAKAYIGKNRAKGGGDTDGLHQEEVEMGSYSRIYGSLVVILFYISSSSLGGPGAFHFK